MQNKLIIQIISVILASIIFVLIKQFLIYPVFRDLPLIYETAILAIIMIITIVITNIAVKKKE